MTDYTIATDARGNRGLYVDGQLAATWDRKEPTGQIARQIVARAGSTEVEYTEITLEELAPKLEGKAEGKTSTAKGRQRSPKGRLEDPDEPAPARVDN